MANGIGEQLREAREARGISLQEIEDRTKIRSRFLRAIEDEDWDVLPGKAYVRSFLHTYAEALGLDADAVVSQYRRAEQPTEEHAAVSPAPESRVAEPHGPRLPRVPRPGRLGIASIALLAVLGIVIVLGLATGSDDDGGKRAGKAASANRGKDSGGRAPAPEEEPPPERVKLQLTTTGTVWVCVLDEAGRPVVEGVTLPAGEEQGPFRGRSFDVGLGNGLVDLRANGEQVPIPAAAEPVGFRITPEGARELAEGERPTCA